MQKSTGKYYDHTELTALWNRVNKLRNHGGGSGSGTLSDIIIDDDNEKQTRFLYDVAIDPDDESQLIFSRNPIDFPAVTTDDDQKDTPESYFIYDIEIDENDDHKLILKIAPVPQQEQYTLPIASADTLGGIKVGEHLQINDSTGVLDAIWPAIQASGSGNYVQSVTYGTGADAGKIIVTYTNSVSLSDIVPSPKPSNDSFLKWDPTLNSGAGGWKWDNSSYVSSVNKLILHPTISGGSNKEYNPASGSNTTINVQTLSLTTSYGSVTAAADSSNNYNPIDADKSVTITIPKNLSHLTDDILSGHYLPLSGGTLTGNLTIGSAGDRKDLIVYGKSTLYNTVVTNGLYVPTSMPSPILNPIPSGTTPFWIGEGEYAQDPGGGGGVTSVYDLIIKRNGITLNNTYQNLGEHSIEVNIEVPTSLNSFINSGSGFLKRNGTTDTWSLDTDVASITYVDSKVAGATFYKGDFSATGDGSITGGTTTIKSVANKVGDMYVVTTATPAGQTWPDASGKHLDVGDSIIFKENVAAGTLPTSSQITFVQGTVPVINENATLNFGTNNIKIASVEGVEIKVNMPSPPAETHKASDHTNSKLTLQVAKAAGGNTSIGTTYNALAADTYTITRQAILDAIGTTQYAPYWAQGYVKKDGDTMSGALTINSNLTVTGTNTFSGILNVPAHAPGATGQDATATAPFWLADGEYAQDPGGGGGGFGGGILTIQKNSHNLSPTYDGSEDISINIDVPTTIDELIGTQAQTNGYLKRNGTTGNWSIVNETYVKTSDISTGLNRDSSTGAVTLAKSTTTTLGGIIISNALSEAVTLTEAAGATANRYYGVQVDNTGKAFVNIPWTDTQPNNGTLSFKINNDSTAVTTFSANQSTNSTLTFKAGSNVTITKDTNIITIASSYTDTNTAQMQISDTTNKKINTIENPEKWISFTGGTNKFTVTDAANTTFDVAITPSITNNVTYTTPVTAGQLTVWNSAGVITDSGYTVGQNGTLFGSFTGGGISKASGDKNVLVQASHALTIGGQEKSAGSSSINIIENFSASASSEDNTTASKNNLNITVSANGLTASTNVTNLYATYLKTQDTASNKDYYMTFVDGHSTTAKSFYTDGDIKYNPSTNTLTGSNITMSGTGTFSGTLYVPTHTPGSGNTTAAFWLAEGEYAVDPEGGGSFGGGTLTIQKNHQDLSPTYNGSEDISINIDVPTVVDDLLGTQAQTNGYLKRNGTTGVWSIVDETYVKTSDISTGLNRNSSTGAVTLAQATTTTLGGIKVYNVLNDGLPSGQTAATDSTNGRYYGVQITSTGQAFVNVPWTDHTYTVNDAEFSIYAKKGTAAGDTVEVADFTANQASNDSITFEKGDNITFDTSTAGTLKISAVVPTIPAHRTLTLRTVDKVTTSTVLSTLSPIYNPVGDANQTIDIPIPTTLGQLTNDSNYLQRSNIKTSGTGNYITGVTVGTGNDNDVTFTYGSVSGLLTAFSGGELTSQTTGDTRNTITQANHSITVGGTTLTAGSSSVTIVKDVTLTLSSADSTTTGNNNLSVTVNVNGVSDTKTIQNLYARYAATVKTQSRSTNADHYLTFVDSNNGTATHESLYTDAGIKYNPSTDTLTGINGTFTGILNVPAHAPGVTGTGSTDTVSFWLADGEYSQDQGGGGGFGGGTLTIQKNSQPLSPTYDGSEDVSINIEVPTSFNSFINTGGGYLNRNATTGNWSLITDPYSVATYNTTGLVKPAYSSTNAATLTTAAASNSSTPTIAAKTTTSGRYYGVEIDKNGVLFVNVPWTDTISNSESITYASLKTKRNNGTLVPGQWYRITDYVATTVNAESRSANHPFDLVVLAQDESHLFAECYAAQHSGDSYFNGVDFTKWKVWYSLDNDTTRFTWADSTNGKGVIYRLIDEWNNDVAYDFKGIQFKRYKVTAKTANPELAVLNGMYLGRNTTGSESSYNQGLDIDTSDYKWFFTFSLLGNTLAADATDASLVSGQAFSCIIESTPYDHTRWLNNIVLANGPCMETYLKTYGSATYWSNQVASDVRLRWRARHITAFGGFALTDTQFTFRHNTIVGVFRHNTCASNVQQNTIVCFNDASFNKFGESFYENIIVTTGNFVGNNFIYAIYGNVISIDDQFSWNTAHEFFQNTIKTDSGCYITQNNFGVNFNNNTIYCELVANTFANAVKNNTFGTLGDTSSVYIQDNVFGVAVNNCTFKSMFNFNQLSGQLNNCSFGAYVVQCVFEPMISYVDIADGTSSTMFSNVHVCGNIRGTSSAHIALDSSEFRQSGVGGVHRRVTLQGDKDGKLVATWYDGQHRTGIYKATSANSWTPLPAEYSLPIASNSVLGGIKVGTNLSIDANGTLSATDTTYTAGTKSAFDTGTDTTTMVWSPSVLKSAVAAIDHTHKITVISGLNNSGTNISATSTTAAANPSVTLAASGVTAGEYGTSGTSAVTPGYGETFSVPYFKVNEQGIVIAAASHNVTMPSIVSKNVTYTGTLVADEIAVWNNTTGVLKSSGYKVSDILNLLADGVHYRGDFTATGDGAISGGSSTIKSVENNVGDMYIVSTAGTTKWPDSSGKVLQVGDSIIFKAHVNAGTMPTSSQVTIVQGTVAVTDSAPTLKWGTSSTIATIEGVTISASLPTFTGASANNSKYVSAVAANGTTGNITVSQASFTALQTDLIPNATNTQKIGDTNKYFSWGYFVNLAATNALCIPTAAPASGTTIPSNTNAFWLGEGEYSQDQGGGGGTGGGVLTIQKNQQALSPTYDGSTSVAINIDVPTSIDDIVGVTPGSGFLKRNGTTGAYSFDNSTYSTTSHTHYYLVTEGDNRNTNTTPNNYTNNFVFRGLKTNSVIGLSSLTQSTYSYVIGLRGWSDSSGGNSHELAFNNSGIYRRDGATTTWNSWVKLADFSEVVASVSINGNNLRVTKNGSNTDLTIPFATTASKVGSSSVGSNQQPIYLNNGTPTVSNPGEAYLTWGGKNFSASYGPIDAAMVDRLGANRMAFPKATAVVIEYSRDGGATWTDYGATDAYKIGLFTSELGQSFSIGKSPGQGDANSNCRLRITYKANTAAIYTSLNKFIVYISTSGSSDCRCTITARTKDNSEGNVDTWTTIAENVPISGWSGYNVINTTAFTAGGSYYWDIRFTFTATHTSTQYTTGLTVTSIRGFGGVGWTTTSNMGTHGHLYNWDASQNMITPASVLPKTNNNSAFTLGSSSYKWYAVYATTLYGNLDWSYIQNKPTIPTVYDATFSIYTKANSSATATTLADFTANQSTADDVTFIAGTNVTFTTGTRTLTIAATDTIPNNATFSIYTKTSSTATATTLADFTADQSAADDVTFIAGTNVTFTTGTRTLTIASTDTKNTVGADNTNSKIFLVGTTAQTTSNGNAQSYSHTKAYIGTDHCLYSNNEKVMTASDLTAHSKIADTTTAGWVLISKATNTYEWRKLTLDDVDNGTTRTLANYLPLAGGEMSGNITVGTANSLDLGSSSKDWKNIYVRNVISNDALEIKTTASSKNLTLTSTGQAIINSTGNIDIHQKISSTNYNALSTSSGAVTLGNATYKTTLQGSTFDIKVGSNVKWTIDSSGNLVPNTTNNVNIGSTTKYVNNAYITNGTVTTLTSTTGTITTLSSTTGTITTANITTGNITNADITASLAIPSSAPSSPASGKTYFWLGEGEYAIDPGTGGGGGTGGATLTIQKNGTTIATYTGAQAKTANITVPINVSELTNDSGYLTSHQTIKQNGVTGATRNNFGTCSVGAGTAAKTVNITSGTPTLEAGLSVVVKFTYANTASNPTLNVNSKGAKNIFYKGSQITTDNTLKSLLRGVCHFVYDGTQWHLLTTTADTWSLGSTKPSYALSEITGTDDLQLIEALTGDGLLKRSSNAWSLDTTTYLSSQDHYKNTVTSNNDTTTSGSSITIPYISVNTDGHVTNLGTRTHNVTGFLTAHAYNYGKITPGNSANTTTEITGNTTSVESTSSHETLKLTAKNKWIVLAGSNGAAGADEIQFAHKAGITAATAGTNSATSGSTLDVPYVTYDEAGHVTASGTHTHTITGFSTTDTKNTVGGDDSSSKLFLVGITAQTTSNGTARSYTQDTAYVGTDGCLYSNNAKVLTSIPTASADTLGGVKVGAGLSITDGVLSATGGGTADAVDWSNVLNKPTTLSGYGITDAVGAVSSTDNAIARFDGTQGQIQNSVVTIADTTGNMQFAGSANNRSISYIATNSTYYPIHFNVNSNVTVGAGLNASGNNTHGVGTLSLKGSYIHLVFDKTTNSAQGQTYIYLRPGPTMAPNDDDTIYLGGRSNRWKYIYGMDIELTNGIHKYVDASTIYNYTLPNASGTLALTSNLSAYVLKAGDTMSGDLRLSANNLYFGSASGSQCHVQYDNTNKCLNFLFD